MTNPSWDSSGKVTTVGSLRPLTALPLLEEVNLFGIVPPDGVIDDLLGCATLRRAKVSKYPAGEVERLRAAMKAGSAAPAVPGLPPAITGIRHRHPAQAFQRFRGRLTPERWWYRDGQGFGGDRRLERMGGLPRKR